MSWSWRRVLAALGLQPRFRVRRLFEALSAERVLEEAGPGLAASQEPETCLLEDIVSVLHPDGTRTRYYHAVVHVADAARLDGWEVPEHHRIPVHLGRFRLLRGRVLPPGGGAWVEARHEATASPALREDLVLLRGLVPGCVVDLEVQFDWYRPDQAGPHLYEEVLLRTSAPTRLRRVVLAVPVGTALRWEVRHGEAEPVRERRGRYELLRWEVRGQPGIASLDRLPCARDAVTHVEASTCPDWAPLVASYRRTLGLDTALPAGGGTVDFRFEGQDPRTRALEAFRHVASRVRYGRSPDEVDVPEARSPGVVARSLRGDCKDKVALLADLLAEAGWESELVLVEMDSATRTPFLPAPRFDHVVLRARRDGVTLWLEPTPGTVDFDYLPPRLQGRWGLPLREGVRALERLPLPPLERDALEVALEAALDDDGVLALGVTEAARGDFAEGLRAALLRGGEEDLRAGLRQERQRICPGAALGEFALRDAFALDVPARLRASWTLPHWSRPAGRFRLVGLPWRTRVAAEPFAEPERALPLLYVPRGRVVERLALRVPAGWVLAGGEQEHVLASPLVRYELRVWREGDRVLAERRFEVEQELVPPDRYAETKALVERAARLDRVDLVFEAGG